MGYRSDGRARFVTSDTQTRLFDSDGNGLGAILVDGLAVAAWTARTVGRRLEIDLDLFEQPRPRLDAAVRDGFADVARVLGLDEATMRVVDGPLGRRLSRRLAVARSLDQPGE